MTSIGSRRSRSGCIASGNSSTRLGSVSGAAHSALRQSCSLAIYSSSRSTSIMTWILEVADPLEDLQKRPQPVAVLGGVFLRGSVVRVKQIGGGVDPVFASVVSRSAAPAVARAALSGLSFLRASAEAWLSPPFAPPARVVGPAWRERIAWSTQSRIRGTGIRVCSINSTTSA